MTPKYDLSGVTTGCAKPSCDAPLRTLHRHHKGNERSFWNYYLRRFINTPAWHALVERYLEFHESDIVRVCPDHHEEIHCIYDEEINLWILNHKLQDPCTMSLTEAQALMAHLRTVCDQWLTRKTRGRKNHRHLRSKQ